MIGNISPVGYTFPCILYTGKPRNLNISAFYKTTHECKVCESGEECET